MALEGLLKRRIKKGKKTGQKNSQKTRGGRCIEEWEMPTLSDHREAPIIT